MSKPQSFGRYTVKERLGRGAMGVVYRAEDPVIGREVAIKVIRTPPGATEHEQLEMQARFEREFRSAGTLSHPNIVTIHDVGQQGDESFIAMELVRGRSLADILHSSEILSFKDVSDIVFQICSALDYAHDRGIVHRDIKPANILMTRQGQAKITDFGVAKLATGTLTRTGTIIGTPAYMSPEQVQGHTATPASDQFSVAILVYEMLTGELPFSGESPTTIMYKIVHVEPIKPHDLNRSLPERIDRVLMRALHKSPERRYTSCTDFAEAIREVLGASPPTTTVSYTPAARQRYDDRRVWISAGVATAVLLGGFLGWMVWGGAGDTNDPLEDPRGGAVASEGGGSQREGSGDDSSSMGDSAPGAGDTASGAGTQADRGDTDAPQTGSETLPAGQTAGETAGGAGTTPSGEETARSEPPEPLAFSITSNPSGATVTFDGRRLATPTPATVQLLPERDYRLVVELEGYDPVSYAFTLGGLTPRQIEEGVLHFPLTSSVPPGVLVVDGGFPVSVAVGGRTFEPQLRHEITLSPGSHQVALSAPSVFFEQTRTVEVTSDEQVSVQLPTLYTVNVIALPIGAACAVSIDGREAGTAPLSGLSISEGQHEFRWDCLTPEASRTKVIGIFRDQLRVDNRAQDASDS